MRAAHGHPLAPPSGIVAESRLVLYDKIGPGDHQCHWCGVTIRWVVGKGPGAAGALLADHVDWDIHNDDPENLVPSCNHCNHCRTQAGNRNRIADGELITMKGGRPTRAVKRQCEGCGADFLTVPAEVQKGKGRFCSRSCARRHPRKK